MSREGVWDVVLMDMSMPDRNGIDALKLLKKEQPRLPVLVLSMHPEDQYAVRALRAGAAGYLTKDARRTARQGDKSASPGASNMSARRSPWRWPTRSAKTDAATKGCPTGSSTCPRSASGKSRTEIAEDLNLSVKTVSTYRARVLEKMGMHSNAELTHYGLKFGLVE